MVRRPEEWPPGPADNPAMLPAEVLLLLTAGFAVPILGVLAARAHALRGSAERVARWFAFARTAHLLVAFGSLGWLLIAMAGISRVPRETWFALGDGTPVVMGLFLVMLAPVGVIPAILGVIIHDVATRLETTVFGWRETLERSAWLAGSFVIGAVPLAMGALALTWRQTGFAVAWFLLGAAWIVFALGRSRRGLALSPHAVTHGALRDRIFEIAERAGVRLQQLYALPVRRLPFANAFAVQGSVVMVTDLLLQRLTRDEVDAVLAHEIAHLRRGDPLRLLVVRLASVLVPSLALASFGWGWMAAGWMLGFAVANAYSRSVERAADLESLRLGGRGSALISGLVRLARWNHVPLRWGRWSGWMLTHPTVEDRARAIGTAAGLGADEVRALLDGHAEAGDHYGVPATIADETRIFSTRFKQRAALGNALLALVIAALVPAAIFAEARLLDWPYSRGVLVLLALLVTPAAVLAGFNFAAVQPLRRIRASLARRLGTDDPADGWFYCGLAPHERVRLYEGFTNWDVGFARLHGAVLEFVGEECRFELPADRVTGVELVAGPPAWVRARVVLLRWRGADGTARALRLTPMNVEGLHAVTAESRRRIAEIEQWLAAARPFAGTARGADPPAGEVTSQDLRAAAPASSLVVFAIADLVLGALLGATFGLGFEHAGPLEIAAVAFASQVLLLIPFWRHREPAPAPESAPRESRAA